MEEETEEPARVRFIITARRVRIDPDERRSRYIHRLERLIGELDRIIADPEASEKIKLRAMDVLIRAINVCYGIVIDIEVEQLEDELKEIEEENRRTAEAAGESELGYEVEEDPAP